MKKSGFIVSGILLALFTLSLAIAAKSMPLAIGKIPIIFEIIWLLVVLTIALGSASLITIFSAGDLWKRNRNDEPA